MKKYLIMSLFLLLSACMTNEKIVYKSVYPSLNPIQSPLVLNTSPCKWSYPTYKDDKIFIGMDEQNFKCYLKNQEIQREQRKLYEQTIEEINKERAEWNELNKNNLTKEEK